MNYISSWERFAFEEGFAIGREEGFKEGEIKGLQRGVTLLLAGKFGTSGQELVPEVQSIADKEVLEQLVDTIVDAPNLVVIRDHLNAVRSAV